MADLKYGICDCEYPCSCVGFEGRVYGDLPAVIDALMAQRDAPRDEERRGWDINRDCPLTGAPLDSCSCDDCADRRGAVPNKRKDSDG